MSSYEASNESRGVTKSRHRLAFVLGAIMLLLTAWQISDYPRSFSSIGLVASVIAWLRLNLSMFRISIIVGFGGTLLSIPLLRRRGRNRDVQPRIVSPESIRHQRMHPLMLTPRPSRDSQFVIRKTKNKGRIARNRDGERLPPTQPQ